MTVESRNSGQIWLAIIIVGVMLVANVIATRNVFTKPFPGHNDFMTPWEASRAFWIDGLNPYGPEATDRIQMRIFGREPLPEEDPGFFSYPLYATYLIVPTIHMDYDWASAAWMVALEVCLVVALFLLLSLFDWQPKPGMMITLILWALFFYPAARGLILGQLSHIGYLLQVLTLWALYRKQDNVAGIALAISTFKPQMGYLLVPFLLLWALQRRRWQFFGTFVISFLTIMATTFVIYPGWFGEWLHRLSVYPSYTLGSPMWILTQNYLGLGDVGEIAGNIIFYAMLLAAWMMILWWRQDNRFVWVVMWTLTITHIVAPRTASPHFVVFTIMVIFYASMWRRHEVSRANWRIGLMLGVLFLLPWMHFLATVGGVAGEQEDPSTHLILPLVMLGVLWLSRRMWWEHAPRFTTSGSQPREVVHETVAQ